MTIDVTIPRETKSLIRPLQRTFYPTEIPEQHHQLKNFISTAKQDVIYYASQNEIYALHISTRKRELIASLPWKPQCLDAACGWIGVGGSDGGRCAFVNTDQESSNGSRDRAVQHHTEVDTLLPLELDPESRLLAHSNFLQQRGQTFVSAASTTSAASRGKVEVQIHEVGGSIVNSVTIHRLCSDREGFHDEIVAVITNNDHTVRIFSLSQSRILDTLNFPTPMNHATISPDGKFLLAVGDEPQAFFCGRTRLPSVQSDGEPAYARYEWHEIAEPKLSLAHSSDACFSTAFSPSGHICAVASQTGVITIFDTSMIHDDMDPDDAVLDVLKSSRPCVGRDFCGAVRAMSFAPAPWDLFAWAEDQGRVCVIDLRNAFLSRQTIELETDSPSLNRVIMSDLEDSHSTAEQRVLEIEARFVQRHREALEAQDHLAAVNHAANFMELAAERRRIEREARENGTAALREEHNSLTESERQMLDTIRMSRFQENEQERADAAHQTPYSVNYVPTSTDGPADAQLSLGSSSNNSSSISPSSLQSSRGTGSIQDYMRQRSLDRSRAGERTYQPRHRSSVVISNGNPTNNSSSAHPSSLAPIGTATPTISASPSRLASATEANAGIPTARESSRQSLVDGVAPGNPIGEAATRLRRERDTALARTVDRRVQQQQHATQQAARLERVRNASANMQRLRQLHGMTVERARAVENLYDDHELDTLRRFQETRGRRDEGVRTMGVGWSGDGRNLYVATEDGILEYTVNIDERKTFPGMTLQ